MAIDLNRGVTKRNHQELGMPVHMYKDAPGVYFDVYGNEVDVELAAEAGFDTKSDEIERKKQEKIAKAMAEIDKEFGERGGSIVASDEKSGMKVIAIDGETCNVLDADGKTINERPLPYGQGKKLMNSIAKMK